MAFIVPAADAKAPQGWIRSWVASKMKSGAGEEKHQKPQLQVEEEKKIASSQQQQQKQGIKPRFAAEFDGLNCFETIVAQ